MSNVVPFRSKEQETFMTVTVVINTSSPLEEGDLVAWQFMNTKIGQTDSKVILFAYWWPPSGRDHKGRFVRSGSPKECAYLDFMRYSAEDLQRGGIKILGKVSIGTLLDLFRAPAN